MVKIKITDIKLDGPPVEGANVIGDAPMIVPIVVTNDGHGGISIVDGRRRIADLRGRGESEVEAIELPEGIDPHLAGLMLNARRSSNPASEAKQIAALLQEGMTQKELARFLSVSQAWISLRLKLMNDLIPELFDGLENGTVLVSVATRAAHLPEEAQRELLEEANGHITVKDVSARLKSYRDDQIAVDSIEIPTLEIVGDRMRDYILADRLASEAGQPTYSAEERKVLMAAVRILKGGAA